MRKKIFASVKKNIQFVVRSASTMWLKTILLVLTIIVVMSVVCLEAKRSKKLRKGMLLRQKETNAINFIRLLVMRLIYGVATRFGFEDSISGAFVPPGAEEDYGFDLFLRDDYDY